MSEINPPRAPIDGSSEPDAFRQNLPFRFFSGFLVAIYTIQCLALIVSLLQLTISAWAARGILALAWAAFLGILFSNRKTRHPGYRFNRRHLPAWAFLIFVLAVYFLLWIAAYHMPDLSWDGNAYHIPTIAFWDQVGRVHWVNTPYLESIINGYPKGAELVTYILVKAFNNNLINTGNLVFLPLGVLGINILARKFGTPPLLALCAGSAYVLIPINIGQSPTSYVDAAFAASVVAFFALTILLADLPRLKSADIALYAVSTGIMISIKSTGIAFAALGIFTLEMVRFLATLRSSTSTRKPWRKTTFHFIGSAVVLLLLILLISLPGEYWYLRNWILGGSPLYPVGISILGHPLFPGVPVTAAISGAENTPDLYRSWSMVRQVLNSWLQGLDEWPQSIKGYDSRFGGLGFLWLLGCVPSILGMLYVVPRVEPAIKRSTLLLLSITALSFLATPMRWWARYTLWIYAIGLPCLAWFAWKISSRKNLLATLDRIWMAICVGMLLLESGYAVLDILALASPQPLRANLANPFDPKVWEWPAAYLFPGMKGTVIEEVLASDATVVLGPHGENDFWHYAGLIGQLCQPIGQRRLIILGENWDLSQGFGKARYVIWDETMPLPPYLETLAIEIKRSDQFVILTLP